LAGCSGPTAYRHFSKKKNNKNISTQFLGRLLGPHCLQALFKFPR